jgi:hypothetical protein
LRHASGEDGANGLGADFLALAVVVDHWRILILTPRGAYYVYETAKLGFNGGHAVMFFS